MRHPEDSQMALYAGGDLNFLDRFRIGRHVRKCQSCRGSLTAYRAARRQLREESDKLPEGLEWDRFAAEMTANIRVGLAAGECVGNAPAQPRRLDWRPALAVAGLTALVVSGWWLNFPREQRESLTRGVERVWNREPKVAVDTSVYLDASRAGIQLKENGSAMTLMHPSGAPSVISVSTQGSMAARYIDSDTGQVTITNVYSQ